jgi:hypothetical protein
MNESNLGATARSSLFRGILDKEVAAYAKLADEYVMKATFANAGRTLEAYCRWVLTQDASKPDDKPIEPEKPVETDKPAAEVEKSAEDLPFDTDAPEVAPGARYL